jgi:hypothetical protein
LLLCLQYLLTPGGPIPGECLALNGSKGYVDVKLRNAIVPTALTYEHVPTSIAYDIRSAPQDMSVVSAALTDLNLALYATSARIIPHLKNCSIIYCTFCDFTNEDEKLPSILTAPADWESLRGVPICANCQGPGAQPAGAAQGSGPHRPGKLCV